LASILIGKGLGLRLNKTKTGGSRSANLPVLPYFKVGRIKRKKSIEEEILSEVTHRSLFTYQSMDSTRAKEGRFYE